MSKKHKKNKYASAYPAYGWRKQPKEAFKLGKSLRPVFGGSFSTMEHKDWAMLICCNGQSPLPVAYASPQALQLMPKLNVPQANPFIRIDWQDLGAPELDREFWESLAYGLQKLGAPGAIGVCCMGGTGRTGTALAILAQMTGAIPAGQCPVGFIRQHYQFDAVETEEQGRYIESITGVPVTTPIEKLYGHNGHSSHHAPTSTISTASAGVVSAKACIHGKPMHLFCPDCMGKSGGIGSYSRDW